MDAADDAGATLTLSGTLSYTGGTTLESGELAIPGWTIIDTLDQLQAIPAYTTGHYLLVTDIDASATATWNDGAGFLPLLASMGNFDGGRHVVSHLTINRPDLVPVGLFAQLNGGNVSIVRLGLEDVDIDGEWLVGGLVGENFGGTISECYVTGTVTGHTGNTSDNPNDFGYVGGLVGGNLGVISRCYSAANVTALGSSSSLLRQQCIGGLAGFSSTCGTYNVSITDSLRHGHGRRNLLRRRTGGLPCPRTAIARTPSTTATRRAP